MGTPPLFSFITARQTEAPYPPLGNMPLILVRKGRVPLVTSSVDSLRKLPTTIACVPLTQLLPAVFGDPVPTCREPRQLEVLKLPAIPTLALPAMASWGNGFSTITTPVTPREMVMMAMLPPTSFSPGILHLAQAGPLISTTLAISSWTMVRPPKVSSIWIP